MISEILSPERVSFEIDSTTKEEVVKKMLVGYSFQKPELVLHAILERERLMTTGLGRGIAIPRGFTQELIEPAAALSISRKGIDFDSLDRSPVKIVLLLLFPFAFKLYANYISAALSLLNQETVRTKIPQFDSARELIKFIKEKEV